MRVWIENKGFCRAYYPYTVKLKLVGTGGAEYTVFEETGANLRWQAETVTEESFKLNLKNVPAGEYTLCIGMFEKEKPIRLGFKKACTEPDGFYDFDTVRVTGAE
jgi:hypothetical protein